MKILVQKFGGTSVSSPALRQRVVERVLDAKARGYHPVVVVSAMGRRGDPYATDTLLDLADEVGGEPNRRERDQLAACGEIISSALMAQMLCAAGCPARSMSGAQAGIVTDERFGNARIVEVNPAPVLACLEKGIVPVVAGFQGVTRRGEVTPLGRGGSDTTAAALGGALQAVAVEIYTDVDGIMTADPRLVPDAGILPRLTYQEVAELALQGARVIHPRAVEIARQARVPVRVLSTCGHGPGTLIADDMGRGLTGETAERVVAGIAHVGGLLQVRVEPADGGSEGTALAVLERLAVAGVSLDMIFLSPSLLLFVVDQADRRPTVAALQELGTPHRIREGLAKVSVVGAAMHGVPGVMADVLAALREQGIAVFQTADSHTTISCLVAEADVENAVRALHRRFDLGRGRGAAAGLVEAAARSNGFTGEAGDGHEQTG